MSETGRPSSRISGFYRRSVRERLQILSDTGLVSAEALAQLGGGGVLEVATADRMSENVIACHGLPLAIALNFRINQRDYLVPMAVEEPSVVAAASNAARLVRISGGFTGDADRAVMTAQIQFDDVADPDGAGARVGAARAQLLAAGDAAIPRMVARGGGCVDVDTRVLDRAAGVVVVHVYIDVGDAMGANLVDAVAEALAAPLHDAVGGRQGLRILTNVPLRRMVRVSAQVSSEALGGEALADGIARASRFAALDPLRAATHNKGIMNGVDAVAVALGQDWRAAEAGAHAYAALGGRYRPLAEWKPGGVGLVGRLEMPLAAGVVGGATQVHPGVRAAFEIVDVGGARELAVVMAAAGLASNLAALRALAGEGIQRGHMALHRRRLRGDAPASMNAADSNPPRSGS